MVYSPSTFGYTEDEWERLITATDELLTDLMSRTSRSLPNYSQINREVPPRVGLPCFDLHTDRGRNGLGALLGSLNDRLWDEARCLVSSVVVHSGDAASPIGKGFYSYAQARDLDPGRTASERQEFLLNQQSAAARFWQGRRAAQGHS